jgi:pyruvate,water dikinase
VVPSSEAVRFTDVAWTEQAATEALRDAAAATGLIDPPWAVRSSAVEEDSVEHSFAGQFETVLGVSSLDELAAAVARCVASLAAPRVEAYRRLAEQSAWRPAAVLIQSMVPADRSGIAFSRHPITGADEIVINASYGLGDLVVSGQVTPDEFVLDARSDSLRITVGRKHQMHVLVRGEPTKLPVPASMRAQASLSNAQSEQIADLVRRSEAVLGYPVDIEWAISRGRPFLLQARPITAADRLPTQRSGGSDVRGC